MYSNEDSEQFYIRYKAEALPMEVSIQSYCMKNKVSWNLFNKWYTDTRHRVVPVIVDGPSGEEEVYDRELEDAMGQMPDREINNKPEDAPPPYERNQRRSSAISGHWRTNERTHCFSAVIRWLRHPLCTIV